VKVPGNGIFEVEMELSNLKKLVFTVSEAVSKNVALDLDSVFLATFSFETGLLHLPMVKVHDAKGEVQWYKNVQMLVVKKGARGFSFLKKN
jgi:hypothetical protein